MDAATDRLGYIGDAATARFVAARLGYELALDDRDERVVLSFEGPTVTRHAVPAELCGSAGLVTCIAGDGELAFLDAALANAASPLVLDFSPILAEAAERLHGACAARSQAFHACAFQHRPQAGARTAAVAVLVDTRTVADARAMARLAALAPTIDCVGGAGSAKTVVAIEAALETVVRAASQEALDLGATAGVAPNELLALLVGGSGSNAWLRQRQGGARTPTSASVGANSSASSGAADSGARAQALARALDHPLLFVGIARQLLRGDDIAHAVPPIVEPTGAARSEPVLAVGT